MKYLIVLVLAILSAQAEDTYTTENDDLDIDSVVQEKETLKSFVNCFLEKGECNAVAGAFKKDIAEAVEQSCAKCTEAQKIIFKKFLDGLKSQLPQEFEDFKKKFDPQGIHYGPLEASFATL